MGKHWRRRGGLGTAQPALLLSDLGFGQASIEPNAAFQAVPAATYDLYVNFDGGGWDFVDSQAWPTNSILLDYTGYGSGTLVARITLNTGLTVDSNTINI